MQVLLAHRVRVARLGQLELMQRVLRDPLVHPVHQDHRALQVLVLPALAVHLVRRDQAVLQGLVDLAALLGQVV